MEPTETPTKAQVKERKRWIKALRKRKWRDLPIPGDLKSGELRNIFGVYCDIDKFGEWDVPVEDGGYGPGIWVAEDPAEGYALTRLTDGQLDRLGMSHDQLKKVEEWTHNPYLRHFEIADRLAQMWGLD